MYQKQIYLLLILPLISILGWSSLALSQEKLKGASAEKIAVLNFRNAEKQYSDFEIQSLVDALREAFIRSPFFVLTQENMQALLPSDQILEDCIGKCEVEVGRMLGASHVVTGLIGQSQGKNQLLLRMHHSKSGRLIAQAQARFQSLQELRNQMSKLAYQLLSYMSTTQQSRRDLVVLEIEPLEIASLLKGEINGYPFLLSQLERLDRYFLLPISPGFQELSLQAKDYFTAPQSFEFVSEKPMLLKFTLHPKAEFGEDQSLKQEILELYTKPADVSIWINGKKYHEKTIPLIDDPTTGYLRLSLPRGKYLIEAQKQFLLPQSRSISLQQKYSFKQQPIQLFLPKASLSIESDPNALLRLNQQGTPIKTPWKSDRLDYQPYWIELSQSGYQSKELLVVPQIGQTKELTVSLVKSTASLSLSIKYRSHQGLIPVPNASIWLDQAQIGESDARGQFHIDQLMAGEHLLQIRHPYYLPKFQGIRLENTKESQKEILMDSAFAALELNIDVALYEPLLKNPLLREQLSKQAQEELASIDILWGNVLIKEINLLDEYWISKIQGQRLKVELQVNEGNKELLVSPKKYGLFDDYQERISLKVGHRKIVPISLNTSYTQLKLDSIPSGSQVFLDENTLGKTPIKGKIKAGIYVLKLEQAQQPSFSKLLVAQKNQAYQEMIDLNQRSLVNISCIPQQAKLLLDGKLSPQKEWLTVKHGAHWASCSLWGIEKKQGFQLGLSLQKHLELKLDEQALSWYKTKAMVNQQLYQGLWITGTALVLTGITAWIWGYEGALDQRDSLGSQWLNSIDFDAQNRYAQQWANADTSVHQWHQISIGLLISGLSSAVIGGILWKYGPRL